MTTSRLNLILPERSIERLERLKMRTDASSMAEVIRSALTTYESIVDHLSSGCTFTVRQPNGETIDAEFLIDVQAIRPRLTVVQ